MNQLIGNETMKQIRTIIQQNECLHGIKTSGKGRTKQVIIKEINEKIASVKQPTDEDQKEEKSENNNEVKKAQQRIQFNMTDILLFHQDESHEEIRFLVEYGINRPCDAFSNALFKDKKQITLNETSATRERILKQIKHKWNKLSSDDLNNYDAAKRKIYVKHYADSSVLFKGGSYLCDVRDDWDGEMYYENKWRFVINDYKNDYTNNTNIVFEYKLFKQTRIDNQWIVDKEAMNLDRFCKEYEITFKSDGFVDALGWWPKKRGAADWRNEFEDNESVSIQVIARDVTREMVIACDNIEFRIVDIGREFEF